MEKLKTLYRYLWISIPLILVNVFLYFQMVLKKPEITSSYKLVFLVFSLIINILVVFMTKYISKLKTIKFENLFLLFSLSFGILYMCIVPVMLGTDELAHFYRSYQISVGDIIVKNPEVDSTPIPEKLANLAAIPMKDRYSIEDAFKKTDYNHDLVMLYNPMVTSIKYSPIPYLPQVIGFRISNLFSFSPLLSFFIVRGINFLVWVILGYYAFKLLPCKKMFALVLYISPAVLSLVSTSSGDAFANAASFLLFAYILNLIKTKKKLKIKDYILISLLALVISTFKTIYIIFLGFLYLIPKQCFKDNSFKLKVLYLSLIILAMLAVDLGWMVLSAQTNITSNSLAGEQLSLVLNKPIWYLGVLINSYINSTYYFLTNLVAGDDMCYGLVRINDLFIIVYFILFIISYFNEKNFDLKIVQRVLILIIFCVIFGGVNTIMYIDWTTWKSGVGAISIKGVQSRYFISFILPFMLALPSKLTKKILNIKEINLLYTLIFLSSVLLLDVLKSLLLIVFPS